MLNKSFTSVLSSLILVTTLAACATTEPISSGQQHYQQAMEAFEKEQYQTAIQLFEQAAQQGVLEAQYSLGLMYQDGIGVSQDTTKAQYYFEQAVQQGSQQAQTHLNQIYYQQAMEAFEKGEYATTYRLFKQLADQGVSDAQYNLGLMYQDGIVVPQNKTMAKQYFEQAAKQGSKQAQEALRQLNK